MARIWYLNSSERTAEIAWIGIDRVAAYPLDRQILYM